MSKPRTFCGIPRATDPESVEFWRRVDNAAAMVIRMARRIDKSARAVTPAGPAPASSA